MKKWRPLYSRAAAPSENRGISAGRSENDVVFSPGISDGGVDIPVSVIRSGGCGVVFSVLIGVSKGAVCEDAGSSVSSV